MNDATSIEKGVVRSFRDVNSRLSVGRHDVVLSMTGAGRSKLAGALAALSDPSDWKTHANPKRPYAIAISCVLSEAWSDVRLERSARLLAARERAPAISVVRYCLRGHFWYGPSDGNHRTEAARIAGRRLIRAEIGGTYVIRLDEYVLRREFERERLWRAESGGARYRLVLESSDEVAATLERLGVRRVAGIERTEHPALASA